jgi:hypothetical protein
MLRAIKVMATIKYIMVNIFVFNASHILLLFNQLIQIEKDDNQVQSIKCQNCGFQWKGYGCYLAGLGLG